MPIKLLALLFIVILIQGCFTTTWPSKQYKGLSIAYIQKAHKRHSSSFEEGKAKAMPPSCQLLIESAGKTVKGIKDYDIRGAWGECSNRIKINERKHTRRMRNIWIAEEKKRDEESREKGRRELKEYGPNFMILYERAKWEGAANSNKVIARYGKVDTRQLNVYECELRQCVAGPYQPNAFDDRGMAIPINGVYAKSGTPLSKFKFVRLVNNASQYPPYYVYAIFTRRD